MPLVGVVMGSASDEPVVKDTVSMLEQLGIDYEVRVMSAHRTPERVAEYAQQARERGGYFIGLDFGEEAELAEVDAGHRYADRRRQPQGADDGPIAAKGEGQVRAG